MKKKMLYIDGSSGISGDMFVGAMLDLGADRSVVSRVLQGLPDQEHFTVRYGRMKKSAVDCFDFDVVMDGAYDNHDHDMAYLYGTENPYAYEDHGENHGENHHHDDPHVHGGHHVHRTMGEIREILDGLDMTPGARQTADRIFAVLAEAESKVHAVPPDEVHFHEVGAIDSIADIVAAAVCLDNLGVTETVVSPLTEGTGRVRTQHGMLPVPVPAVTQIAADAGLEIHIEQVPGEYVTPTGAAIAAAVRTRDRLPAHFRILRTGYGAGKRQQALPGFLRLMLIEADTEETSGQTDTAGAPAAYSDRVLKIETNVDDCTGEMLGFLMKRLLLAGARDVYYTPVYMKKNRPAWQISVLCAPEDREKMAALIFSETTTIGVRYVLMDRTCLPRRKEQVDTAYGPVEVKITMKNGQPCCAPEYESARKAAEKYGVPLQDVFEAVGRAASDMR